VVLKVLVDFRQPKPDTTYRTGSGATNSPFSAHPSSALLPDQGKEASGSVYFLLLFHPIVT
jgi:hypothetical protein